MSNFFKKLGFGLSAEDKYANAFAKGVLLGQENYGKAASLFQEAAEKAREEHHGVLERRATANQLLYSFLSSGQAKFLGPLSEELAHHHEIERIGSQSELMLAEHLRREVRAREMEARVAQIPGSEAERRAQAHEAAAAAFKEIFDQDLITYKFRSPDRMNRKASQRFFYHSGQADWERSRLYVLTDPSKAAEHVARALNCFHQTENNELVTSTEETRDHYYRRRTCWICNREFQGDGIHFSSYPARVTPHILEMATKLGHDVSGVNISEGRIVLCQTCGSAVENMADTIARRHIEELRRQVNEVLGRIQGELKDQERRISRLERMPRN